MIDISNARKDTDELFYYLSDIAIDIVTKYSGPLDNLVKKLSKNIDTLSNEELRTYMAKISIEAYNLSLDREQTALKELCATALYKEAQANAFNNATGTVDARRNQSTIDTMDKQAVSMLYSTVSSLFKAKVDEAHRLASTLSNILISRSAEAKLNYSPRSVSIETQTLGEQQAINNIDNEIITDDSLPF